MARVEGGERLGGMILAVRFGSADVDKRLCLMREGFKNFGRKTRSDRLQKILFPPGREGCRRFPNGSSTDQSPTKEHTYDSMLSTGAV